MRTIIFTLLFSIIIAVSQGQKVYVNLSDASGKQIRGDASMKGFDRWMEALTTSSSAKNNTQFYYTMNISGAAADLKRTMQNGEFLLSGQVTVLQPATTSAPRPAYIIKMEKIRVLGCSEAMGCNGVMTTTVNLQATRIGWIYYQTDRVGTQVISNKYGFDAETGGQWTSF
ncbi:MAG: hypothetical protein ACOYLO_06780 [Ferruginibacter sp.]